MTEREVGLDDGGEGCRWRLLGLGREGRRGRVRCGRGVMADEEEVGVS